MDQTYRPFKVEKNGYVSYVCPACWEAAGVVAGRVAVPHAPACDLLTVVRLTWPRLYEKIYAR